MSVSCSQEINSRFSKQGRIPMYSDKILPIMIELFKIWDLSLLQHCSNICRNQLLLKVSWIKVSCKVWSCSVYYVDIYSRNKFNTSLYNQGRQGMKNKEYCVKMKDAYLWKEWSMKYKEYWGKMKDKEYCGRMKDYKNIAEEWRIKK